MSRFEDLEGNNLKEAIEQVPSISGSRPLDASSIMFDNRRLYLIDSQQSAELKEGDIAVNRSVSGCTILEVDFGDHVEIFHISAGTFTLVKQYPEEDTLDINDKFFARKLRRLGEKSGVKGIRYYINQIHSGRDDDRRERIFNLNATALKNISDNCEILEVKKADGTQTDDMFESVDILTDGKQARVLQDGFIIERL